MISASGMSESATSIFIALLFIKVLDILSPIGYNESYLIETEREMINLVQDRVTGEFYDPMVEFDKLLNSPEVVDQMVRMKEERGRGWPMHPDDKGENV